MGLGMVLQGGIDLTMERAKIDGVDAGESIMGDDLLEDTCYETLFLGDFLLRRPSGDCFFPGCLFRLGFFLWRSLSWSDLNLLAGDESAEDAYRKN